MLNRGWTWFSLYVQSSDSSINAALSSVNAVLGDYIKSISSFAQFYDGYGWYGTLTALSKTSMYKIKLASSQTLSITAPPISASTQLSLTSGWNYLPYLLPNARPLTQALPSFTYQNGDLIKGQASFSTYYAGYGWFGSLVTLEPGRGYMLKLSLSGSTSYATAGGARRVLKGVQAKPEALFQAPAMPDTTSAELRVTTLRTA